MMRSFLLLAFSLTLMPLISHADSCPEKFTTLAAMHNCYRPLLIFAPSTQDPLLHAQMLQILGHPADLRDRQVAIEIILPPGADTTGLSFHTLPPEEEALVRRKFQKDASKFTVVLIGKDGSEKFRSSQAVRISELNRIIDSMPMRREEMKKP
jgi:hypothetical protein